MALRWRRSDREDLFELKGRPCSRTAATVAIRGDIALITSGVPLVTSRPGAASNESLSSRLAAQDERAAAGLGVVECAERAPLDDSAVGELAAIAKEHPGEDCWAFTGVDEIPLVTRVLLAD